MWPQYFFPPVCHMRGSAVLQFGQQKKKNQPEKPSDNIHELNENTLQTTASVCHY